MYIETGDAVFLLQGFINETNQNIYLYFAPENIVL